MYREQAVHNEEWYMGTHYEDEKRKDHVREGQKGEENIPRDQGNLWAFRGQ